MARASSRGSVTSDTVRSSVLTVQLDGADVDARLLMPVGVDGDVPAVVFVHGAGTGKFEDAFVDQARSLAEAGVAHRSLVHAETQGVN